MQEQWRFRGERARHIVRRTVVQALQPKCPGLRAVLDRYLQNSDGSTCHKKQAFDSGSARIIRSCTRHRR